MSETRTVCHTPTPGKKPTTIPTWKYDAIRGALMEIIPAVSPGIASKELPSLVAAKLDAEQQDKVGSITWHTTTVRLNMEVEGELHRVPKVKPLHVYRRE